jgi:hypothetical protein
LTSGSRHGGRLGLGFRRCPTRMSDLVGTVVSPPATARGTITQHAVPTDDATGELEVPPGNSDIPTR